MSKEIHSVRVDKRSSVTLEQVAKHAGVSRATASRIVRHSTNVSADTRNKVLESMRELGYVYDRVAANLRSRKSATVGLIINDIANPVFAEMLIGVHQELDAHGYTVILGTTYELADKQDSLISTMLEYRVGGVIMGSVPGTSKETIERLSQLDIPVVLVREPPGEDFDYVVVDNVFGAQIAMEYLIGNGHRRISFLGGPPELAPWRDRIAGYRKALFHAGIQVDESLIIASPTSRQGGTDAVHQILRHPNPPTAVLCYNDIVAFGVMNGLREAGLMAGRDLAVVGFDDIPEAALSYPKLTTVTGSPRLVGATAASLLHQRITGMDNAPKRIILKPELVIRESCSSYLKL
jgi:LacI family transcriptional regulator